MIPRDPTTPAQTAPDVSEYHAILRPYVARHVQYDDVDDVLQETMLRLYQRQAEQDIDNLNAYAFQTARSVIADRWRRGKARQQGSHARLEEAHHPLELVTPERILAGKEAVGRLVLALEEMPERTRDVFILHRFEDMSYMEIADHMGVSLSAIGKHMVKALRFLAQKDLP